MDVFNLIKNKIIKFKKIIILGHKNPDGDSLGSQIGLQNLLQKNFKEKEILISYDSSFVFNLNFLNSNSKKLIQKDFDNSLIFLVDVNDTKRTEYSNFYFENLIIIDHHKKIKNEKTIAEWIDEKSPATCEMITILAKKLNWNLNEKAATALLTGIITDTGNFKYGFINHETFKNISFLMEKNANFEKIQKNINKITKNDIKIINFIYKNIVFKDKLIYFIFKPENKKDLPFLKHHNEIKKFINKFNFLENNLVRIFFIQLKKEDKINCSLRSNDNFNVRTIANKFNGGGHILASGIKFENWKKSDEIIKEVIKQIKKLS